MLLDIVGTFMKLMPRFEKIALVCHLVLAESLVIIVAICRASWGKRRNEVFDVYQQMRACRCEMPSRCHREYSQCGVLWTKATGMLAVVLEYGISVC